MPRQLPPLTTGAGNPAARACASVARIAASIAAPFSVSPMPPAMRITARAFCCAVNAAITSGHCSAASVRTNRSTGAGSASMLGTQRQPSI
jgi:hypothetical protein